MNTFETMDIEEKVVDVIRTCYDPEIPVNIYELGLIYGVKVDPSGLVTWRVRAHAHDVWSHAAAHSLQRVPANEISFSTKPIDDLSHPAQKGMEGMKILGMLERISIGCIVPVIGIAQELAQHSNVTEGEGHATAPARIADGRSIPDQDDAVLVWMLDPLFGCLEARQGPYHVSALVRIARDTALDRESHEVGNPLLATEHSVNVATAFDSGSEETS